MKRINGDMVCVRPGMIPGMSYGSYTYLEDMLRGGTIGVAHRRVYGILLEGDRAGYFYDENMLINMSDPDFCYYTDVIAEGLLANYYCPCCGVLVGDDGIVSEDGRHFCNEDHANVAHYFKCDVCGKWYLENEGYRDDNGFMCKPCFDEGGYVRCDFCHSIIANGDQFEVDGGTFCGEDCAEDSGYHKCCICGEWHYDAQMVHSRHAYMCRNCFTEEGFAICDDCGNFVLHVEEGNCGWYCDECISYHQKPSRHLRGYHDNPAILFNGYNIDGEEDITYFGLEIETDCGDNVRDYVNDLYEASEGETLFYMEHDGSLNNGVEIITQPMDWDHLQSFPFADIHKIANEYDFKSYLTNTCGLHIHFSRSPYADQDELFEAKLLYYFEKYQSKIEKIARRKYGEWCRPYPVTDDGEIPNRIDLINKVRDVKCDHDDRYHAVNLTNRNTIEIRVFKGTLNENTLLASVEFVKLVADYCYNHTIFQIQNEDFYDSVVGCTHRLSDFLDHILCGAIIPIDDPEADIAVVDE